jgi:hypothetical protein
MLDFLKDILGLSTCIPFSKEISLRIHSSSSGYLYELADSDRTAISSNRFPWRA